MLKQTSIRNLAKHLRFSFLGKQLIALAIKSVAIFAKSSILDLQKQPPRGVLGKRCSENMQKI